MSAKKTEEKKKLRPLRMILRILGGILAALLLVLLVMFLILGVLIGSVGSMISIRRFLDE